MKIAVVGCGALGCYYGALLHRAGEDVHFLLRSDYETVSRDGVLIRSEQGDFQVRPRCAQTPESIGVSDLIVIGLKTTANSQFANLLPPLIGPDTIVVTLQNGLGNEEALEAVVRGDRILGGLCFVCLNRVDPGVIFHLGYGQIVLGEYQGGPRQRTREVADLFTKGGVPCDVTPDLDQAHWEKLAWNIPFNGLGVAGVAGIDALTLGRIPDGVRRNSTLAADRLLADPQWKGVVRELMQEIIVAGRAVGHSISDHLADTLIQRTLAMGPYKASTLIDFEGGKELELDSLFLKPLARAEAAGVPMPRLAALCRILTALEAMK